MPNNIIIDSGNTRTKIYLTNEDFVKLAASYKSSDAELIISFIDNQIFKNSILCNVGLVNASLLDKLKTKSCFFVDFNFQVPIPIKNHYETPETLGLDRLAGAVGACDMFPNANILVVDVGTAITIDLVVSGVYLGGGISPGMRLRFDSLHSQTQRLPLLDYSSEYNYPGSNTHDSILSGVVEGIVNEIDGAIFRYREKYSELKVVLTGGDAYIFVQKIKNPIFAEPNLIARGLNRILRYNVEKI